MQDLFFVASKTIGLAARLETWLLLLMVLALYALWRRRYGWVGIWLGLCFVATLLIMAFPLGYLLLTGLESRYPANPAVTRVDDIIVLGGGEALPPYRRWGGVEVNDAGERLIEGAILARRFPDARLVYTGGVGTLGDHGGNGDPSAINHDAWVALGVASERIVLERASRDTSENASMTRDLLQPGPGQVHLIVTSAFHMPRAMESFARAGWTGLVAWPVDFRSGRLGLRPTWQLDQNLSDIDVALKEYVGLLVYRMAGK